MDPTWLRGRGQYLKGIPAERPYQPVLASAEAAILGFDLEQAADQWDKDRAEIERLREGLAVIADPEYRPGEHSYRATADGQRIPDSERITPSRQDLARNLLESNNGG